MLIWRFRTSGKFIFLPFSKFFLLSFCKSCVGCASCTEIDVSKGDHFFFFRLWRRRKRRRRRVNYPSQQREPFFVFRSSTPQLLLHFYSFSFLPVTRIFLRLGFSSLSFDPGRFENCLPLLFVILRHRSDSISSHRNCYYRIVHGNFAETTRVFSPPFFLVQG